MYEQNVTPEDFRSESSQGRVRETGIFVGIVKQVVDVQSMGRLMIFIPELGGDADDVANWYIMSYASPFAGATDVEKNIAEGEDAKKMIGTQKSYGWWSVPPDINNQVLCCFANGDVGRGFWFACLYQQFMNHMVPAIGLNMSTDDEINKKNLPPVCEYNKKDKDIKDVWDPRRPVFEPLHDAFVSQGLYTDPERGPATSGARRESPSKVFGFLSPRGHSYHIDEGSEDCNEFIRLRTRNGVQLLLHDSTGYVYIISRKGNSWIEISDDGIDMYSKKSISMRSEENINIHADQNIIRHAAGASHSHSTNSTSNVTGAQTTNVGGNQANRVGGQQNNTVSGPQQNKTGEQIKDNSEPAAGDPNASPPGAPADAYPGTTYATGA